LVLLMAGCSGDSESTEQKSLFDMNVEEMFPGNELAQKLALAAADGDIEEMDELVAQGADVNAVGTYGVTVPCWVIQHPNKKGFKHLLELGADPNIIWKGTDGSDSSLIHWTVRRAATDGDMYTDYLKMLFEIGNGDPNLAIPDSGKLPIEWALLIGDESIFKFLCNAGAEVDRRGEYGKTIAQKAGGVFNYNLVLYLLEQGVNYKLKDNHGYSLVKSMNLNFTYRPAALVTEPSIDQYMWFWRCVDWLEKRGEKFDIPADFKRPAKLDTTPADAIFANKPPKVRPTRSSFIHEVNLTYPTPAWAQDQESRRNIQSFFRQKGSNIIYEFIPKGESLNNWNQYQTVTGIYSPNTSYEAFLQAAKDKLVSRCQSDTQMELTEKQADSQLLHVVCDNQDMEGYLFLGKYKNTFVTVYQAWRRTAVKNPEQRRAKVLADMKGIKMEQGFNVVPMTDEMKQKIKQ